jgi:hypothetical protein
VASHFIPAEEENRMLASSRAHLAAAGESYFEHLRFASAVGLMAVGAGLACLIHALIPALCQRTCSTTIGLLQELFGDRDRLRSITARASGAITFTGLVAMALLSGALPMLSGAPVGLGALMLVLALTIPAAFLLSNPELEPVSQA